MVLKISGGCERTYKQLGDASRTFDLEITDEHFSLFIVHMEARTAEGASSSKRSKHSCRKSLRNLSTIMPIRPIRMAILYWLYRSRRPDDLKALHDRNWLERNLASARTAATHHLWEAAQNRMSKRHRKPRVKVPFLAIICRRAH